MKILQFSADVRPYSTRSGPSINQALWHYKCIGQFRKCFDQLHEENLECIEEGSQTFLVLTLLNEKKLASIDEDDCDHIIEDDYLLTILPFFLLSPNVSNYFITSRHRELTGVTTDTDTSGIQNREMIGYLRDKNNCCYKRTVVIAEAVMHDTSILFSSF